MSAAVVSSEERVQLMEERLHSFPSTTEGLLKKKKKGLFKVRVQLMNRSLWELQIAASVEGEWSCFDSDNFICIKDEVLLQLVCGSLKRADDKQDLSWKIAAKLRADF